MNGKLLYLDSSALVKFVLPEPETGALLDLLTEWPERISSALARVEVLLAVRSMRSGEDFYRRAEDVTARIGLVRLDEEIIETAARLEPSELRSLDAIHLATALSVGNNLGAMISYDSRLAEAAASSGLSVLAPGAEE